MPRLSAQSKARLAIFKKQMLLAQELNPSGGLVSSFTVTRDLNEFSETYGKWIAFDVREYSLHVRPVGAFFENETVAQLVAAKFNNEHPNLRFP